MKSIASADELRGTPTGKSKGAFRTAGWKIIVSGYLIVTRHIKDPEGPREQDDQLRRTLGKATVEELLAIANTPMPGSGPPIGHTELLYDEHGLPK